MAAVLNPRQDQILAAQIFVSCRADDLGWLQSVFVLSHGTLDRPGEDAGPFGLQLRRQVRVTLGGWYDDVEGDQVKPSPHSLVDLTQARPVIARDKQFENWCKGEEVTVHKPCGDRVAAGQRLNPRLCPPAAFLRFGGRDEACTTQAGELGRMAAFRDFMNISIGAAVV